MGEELLFASQEVVFALNEGFLFASGEVFLLTVEVFLLVCTNSLVRDFVFVFKGGLYDVLSFDFFEKMAFGLFVEGVGAWEWKGVWGLERGAGLDGNGCRAGAALRVFGDTVGL